MNMFATQFLQHSLSRFYTGSMLTKIIALLFAMLLVGSSFPVMAQNGPLKQWDARFGGSDEDSFYSLQQTADGGYILGGTSLSGFSGDKTQPGQGIEDYWMVKIDSNAIKQWDVRFGGSGADFLQSLQQTAEGGYILGGRSYSGISGDKTKSSQGGADFWVIKTDGNGAKQWDTRFGGSALDWLTSLQQTADGGYILGGWSYSGVSGDKTQASQGGWDFWMVKTDANGVKQWDARFGGNNDDCLSSLQQTADGGYILGGWSYSGISGDKTQGSQGANDYWIVKTDANGVKQWDARFGGGESDFLNSLQQTSDGGYVLGGTSSSGISGDKTQVSQGANDYWIVKTDANGAKQWDGGFGGNIYENLYSLKQTSDGGYILGGYSNSSISGDKTQASQGINDYWIVKTDTNGVKQWDARFGGSSDDVLNSLQQTANGGYILGGSSNSGISGDKTQSTQGLYDYWIVKLASECITGDTVYADTDADGYGNLFSSTNNPTCVLLSGYVLNNTDCDDDNASINPSGIEICNAIDDNCNGTADDGLVFTTYYTDADGDNYGNIFDTGSSWCNNPGTGYTTDHTDCDDVNSSINASSTESCNGIDDNCNGIADDGLVFNTYYADADGDSFGNINDLVDSCLQPIGYVFDNTDCDDNNANVNPNVMEIVNNGIDDNCNGYVDEFGVGIDVPNSITSFSIYPNPAQDRATIQFILYKSLQVNIKLYDLSGKELMTILNVELEAGEHSFQLNTAQFAKGVYVMRMVGDEGMINQKLVVQ